MNKVSRLKIDGKDVTALRMDPDEPCVLYIGNGEEVYEVHVELMYPPSCERCSATVGWYTFIGGHRTCHNCGGYQRAFADVQTGITLNIKDEPCRVNDPGYAARSLLVAKTAAE